MEGDLQQTLVLLKPDAVQRGLVGEIIGRLEQRGLKLVGAKLIQVDSALAEKHYAIHKGKPFYEGLIAYIISSPVIAMVWEGPGAIEVVRKTMGATNPKEASPGSVRHDLGLEIGRNLTHASDASQTAQEEIQLWFSEDELVSWNRDTDRWIYES
jgi:nucleoside-diphosphate kinase